MSLEPPTTADETEAPDDRETREANSIRYGNSTILITPLSSGGFAIFGRDFQLHTILDHAPSADELRRLAKELSTKLAVRLRFDAESRFYGEPDDRTLVKDIKRAAKIKPPRETPSDDPGEVMDI